MASPVRALDATELEALLAPEDQGLLVSTLEKTVRGVPAGPGVGSGLLVATTGQARGARWSPDGRSLLWSDDEGAHLTDWAGRGDELVSTGAVPSPQRVTWDAAGEGLYVETWTAAGRELWHVQLDGSEAQRVLGSDRFGGYGVQAAPDGSALAWSSSSGTPSQVVVYDIASDSVSVITSGEGYRVDLDWSPDSSRIAFRHGGALWVVDRDGTDLEQLTTAAAHLNGLTWSPSGRFLAFSGEQTGVIDLTTEMTYPVAVSGYDWQPMPPCTVTGTAGNDLLTGTTEPDVLCGLAGDDRMVGVAKDDIVLGGPGVDTVDHSLSSVNVRADLFRFRIETDGLAQVVAIEAVLGGSADDTLVGSWGAERLVGGPGDDVVNGGLGADVLEGGPGSDTVTFDLFPMVAYSSSDSFTVDLSQAKATHVKGTVTSLATFENVDGSSWAAEIVGDDGPNHLRSDRWYSSVEGRGGADVIDTPGRVSYASSPGPVDVDLRTGVVRAPDGNDVLLGLLREVVGSSFDDRLAGGEGQMIWAGAGSDEVVRTGIGYTDGGPGRDHLDLTAMPEGVGISLPYDYWYRERIGYTDSHHLTDVEVFTLTSFADTYYGTAGPDRVDTGPGADVVWADAGDDVVSTGAGADFVIPGAGNDLVSTGGRADRVLASDGSDTIRGRAGADRLDGGAGSDRLVGGAGADLLNGGPGRDTCSGLRDRQTSC